MGLGRGWACIGAGLGRVGRVGPARAEWGWGGVGHALGSNSITLRLGPGYKDRPSGAGPTEAEYRAGQG